MQPVPISYSKMIEDDKYVIHGPEPSEPLLNITSFGKLIYGHLLINKNEHEALVDACDGKSISYRELLIESCSLAECLLRIGYGKNSTFAICSENNVEFYIPVMAALYIGAIMAPINHYYMPLELTHALNMSKPKIIFCSNAVYEKMVAMQKKFNFIEKIIVIDCDNVDKFESINTLIDRKLGNKSILDKFQPIDVDINEQVAFIMCSSGTTGLPKGVMITHKNLLVRHMQTLDPRYKGTEKNLSALGLLPFFHAYGLIVNLGSIMKNEKIIVLKNFDEHLFLSTIQNYKISQLSLAPPLIILLAKSPSVKNYDLSCIKEIASGAAPLDKDTERMISERLKVKAIRQGYGLTEVTLGVLVMPSGQIKYGSSGKVISYMSCKVRNPETGKSLGPKQVGELCFKGPLVMKGYINDEEATKNTFTSDGWLLTGDLGYYDEEQDFFIVDRLKDLIKYKGYQVAPAELEAILLTNPKIKDAAVIGIPKYEVGELPLAFIVKNPNVNLTEKEVQDFVAERVSSQKHLRGGVRFVSAIPKSPSGKILKRELKELVLKSKAKL